MRLSSPLLPALVLLASSTPFVKAAVLTDDWGPWTEAKSLHDAGRFNDALQKLREHPSESAAYYSNLGALAYRLSQFGAAVAYFEKAARLAPQAPDIAMDLELARSALAKMIGKDHLDPAASWTETTLGGLPLAEAQGLLGLLSLCLTLLMARSYWKHRRLRLALLAPSGVLALASFALASGAALGQSWIDSQPRAAAVELVIPRSGPGERFIELGRVEAGSKVRLLGPVVPGSPGAGGQPMAANSVWRQIRFSRSAVGWVPASSLLLL